MSAFDQPPTNGVSFRLQNHEERISRIERLEPAVMSRRLDDQEQDIKTLLADFKEVKRALWAFTLTLGGSAIGSIIALVLTR